MSEQNLPQRVASLSREQRAALFERLRAQRNTARPTPSIPRQPRDGRDFPLSFAQQRLWFLQQLSGQGTLFNVPDAFRLRGPLEVEALRRALEALVARHEVLRTTFPLQDEAPRQRIAETGSVPLRVEDLRGLPAGEREAEARRFAREETLRPFELGTGPLLRAALLRLDAEEHVLVLVLHHIAYDGWSAGVLLAELSALYEAGLSGATAALPELPLQYADFAVWQREQFQGEARERHLAYWRKQLAGVPVLQLPLDRPRPPVQTHEGAAEVLTLPPELAAALEALGQQEGCTLFMTMLAAFQALLCHHTGQRDIAVGTQLASRTRGEVEGLIGFFVNTLVMRGDCSGNPTFRELLRRVRDVALDAYTHQDLPFELLVEELQLERDLSRPPLFQVMFVLQNTPPPVARSRALAFEPWDLHTLQVKVDLTLEVTHTPEGPEAALIYNKALFEPSTMARMMAHLRALLEAVASDPDQPLLRLPLLTSDERRFLREWNDTRAPYPRDVCLHQLAEARAEQTPDAIAVEFRSERLTYARLEARANQLAWHLRGLGVGPGTRVGLCVQRSQEMVVAALGILKAGGTYVPLDPEYPADRLAFILEDAGAPVLVTQEPLLARLGGASARRVCCLDRDREAIAAAREDRPASGVGPEHPAYVLYTSGSTGKPKGVSIRHGSVVAFLHAMRERPGLAAHDRLLAITTLAFDIAGLELYLPLLVGARIIVAPREVVTAGELLLQELQSTGATVMQATPPLWRMLVDAGWQGGPGFTALCGGEALPRELADALLARSGAVWNLYGPTEATIWATASRVERDAPISLGRPISNMRTHVLNAALEPVPPGVAGELFLGGDGVAVGYLNRPELTAERFVPDPFGDVPGARLYRTGDLARLRLDGTLEFLGRVDHQVKIRGYRIELGDIEAALGAHPEVAVCVVMAREDRPGSRQLVGYLVPREGTGPSAEALSAWLKEKVPEYMVPSAFVTLESFPLTPNGKVDRKALPAPKRKAADYVAPRTPEEATLARIYAEVLGVERVGIHSSFFALGGDSLLVIRLVARASKAGLSITTRLVFQHPTVAELARRAGQTVLLAEQGEVTGPVPFSPTQRWWMELEMPRKPVYSIAFALEPREALDLAAAEHTVQALARYHDALRLRLPHGDGGPGLVSEPYTPVPLERIDVSGPSGEAREAALKAAVGKWQTDFDLEHGPLFKAAVADLGPEHPQRLVLAGHYLSLDLESWQVLLGDVDATYGQLVRGEPARLPPKGTSFRQWTERLAQYVRSDAMKEQAAYWLSERRRHVPRLPVDFTGGANTVGTCEVVAELLSVEETEALQKEVLKGSEVLIDGALLAALVEAFEPWTKGRALLASMVGHGRPPLFDDVDLSRAVGWININYPALVDLTGVSDPLEAARLANEQLRAIPTWGLGYGLLRYLSPDAAVSEALRRMPQTEVFFNYTGPKTFEYSQFRLAGAYGGYVHDLDAPRPYLLAITGALLNGQLELRWEYNVNVHRRETVERLARATMDAVRTQIARHRRAA